jgi:uncharacterized membrane protein YphA (DoxX/SURF4 family)
LPATTRQREAEPGAADLRPWYERRMRTPPLATVACWLLAFAFVTAGAVKLLRLDFEVEAFRKFGLPLWLMIYVGVFEVAAGVLLAREKTATLGAIVGVAIMAVAVPTHVFSGELAKTPMPLAFLAALVWVGWARRGHLAKLLSR